MANETGNTTTSEEERKKALEDYTKQVSEIHKNSNLTDEEKNKQIQDLLKTSGLFEETRKKPEETPEQKVKKEAEEKKKQEEIQKEKEAEKKKQEEKSKEIKKELEDKPDKETPPTNAPAPITTKQQEKTQEKQPEKPPSPEKEDEKDEKTWKEEKKEKKEKSKSTESSTSEWRKWKEEVKKSWRKPSFWMGTFADILSLAQPNYQVKGAAETLLIFPKSILHMVTSVARVPLRVGQIGLSMVRETLTGKWSYKDTWAARKAFTGNKEGKIIKMTPKSKAT